MPFKHNALRLDKFAKAKYRVTNWPEHNEALPGARKAGGDTMLKQRFTTNGRALIGCPPHYRFLGQDATTTNWLREGENGQVEHFTYEQLAEFQKSSLWRYERDYTISIKSSWHRRCQP